MECKLYYDINVCVNVCTTIGNMKSKKVTIKDVARLSGFSVSTVSHVINSTRFVEEKTKLKVMKAVEVLDYRPNYIARSLKGKGTNTIGFIISDIREGYFSEISKSIEFHAYKKGYTVMLCDSEESAEKEKHYIDVLIRKGIDGLIFAPVNSNSIFKDLTAYRIHTVQIDRRLKNFKSDFVGIDNFKSAREAVLYIYDQGYRTIGFIGYNERIFTMERRIAGYKSAVSLKSAVPKVKSISYDESDVKEVIGEWISTEGIDAVLCGNDNICFETLSAIEMLHKEIPLDMGVISFDDSKWFSLLKNPVTAIRQPTWEMGKTAVQLLIDRIERKGGDDLKEVLLDAELVKRESCLKANIAQGA